MSNSLKAFTVLMVAHWAEHIYQAYQVYALHMPRHCAMGVVGTWFPVLMTGEWLHTLFAILTFGFIGFIDEFDNTGTAERYWNAAWLFSAFHLIEHALLFGQAQTHYFLFGRSEPTSLIQYFVPRIELHLFYNSVVTVLISVAMYYKFREPNWGTKPYDITKDGDFEWTNVGECNGGCNCPVHGGYDE